MENTSHKIIFFAFREQLASVQKRAAILQAEKDELANQAEAVCNFAADMCSWISQEIFLKSEIAN